MNIIEKLYSLKKLDCFAEISDLDLARIADSAIERTYEPNEIFCTAGKTLSRMYIVISGALKRADGRKTPPMFGPASLLLDMQVNEEITASADGACCLVLERGVFFTIIYQHPSIILNLLSMPLLESSKKQQGAD